ncbi:MAG: CYTH domain-containing protein [Candidatus Cyclobacteriaceae bacterium M3_2C_046]
MPQEIERKFLIQQIPASVKLENGKKIRQGYVVVDESGNLVRVRQLGDQFYETVKSPGQLSRKEVEIELSRQQFEALWPLTEGKRVIKTRYYIPYQGKTIEYDDFEEELNGLKMAEVEFESEQESKSFKVPDWFGQEVTYDKQYKNNNLAISGKPD